MSMRHQPSMWDEIDPNNLLRRWLDEAFDGHPAKFSLTPNVEDDGAGGTKITSYDIHVAINEEHHH